ncbi:hypothetical protein [Sporosarcina koreensis]|uniref:hypothetical protein n=1 Tax=Sporosarcina koreensis TaxID=334735 RepID=UPI00075DB559|nr:hypothetical protein [Sporosarcina koreensis]
MELGWSYPRRREIIDKLRANVVVDQNRHPINFQNERTFFPIFKVSIDMPRYRLSNGRTQAAQEEYYTMHDLPEDFFERDIESEDAHIAQHDILKTQLKHTGIDLLDYFTKNGQEEPLILDNNGFVVNGNRRLRAMRELHQIDSGNGILPPKFSHIEVIVLPPCSEEDILELEGKLQITEDIKADYDWTSEGCMYRALRDKKHFSTEKIAGIYDKKKEYIEDLILLLTYVDEYLESRNLPKQYHQIQDDKFAFEAIVKGRKKLDDEDKKDIFQTISFSVLDPDHRLPGMGRLHGFIPKIAENIDTIIEKAQLEFPSEEQIELNDVGLDDGLLGDSYFEEDLINLAQTLNKEENRENVVQVVKDVIDAEDDRRQRYTVIQKIQRANTLLQDAINMFDDDTEREGIDLQLESIETHVAELKGKL